MPKFPPFVPYLSPNQWVPAGVHKTPPSVMNQPLAKRIKTLIKMHGTPLMVISKANSRRSTSGSRSCCRG